MITDLEKFIEVLKAFNHKETDNIYVKANEYTIIIINENNNQYENHKDGTQVRIGIGSGIGYSDFIGEFYFSPEGKARNYGLWK